MIVIEYDIYVLCAKLYITGMKLRWKQVKVLHGPATVSEEQTFNMPLDDSVWEGKGKR